MQVWREFECVRILTGCTVTDLEHKTADGKFVVTAIQCQRLDSLDRIAVRDCDYVFVPNGSMTDASSLGSMTSAPEQRVKQVGGDWSLWEKLAEDHPQFGNPAVFNSSVAQSNWESFTVTLKTPTFFETMSQLSGNEAGTGGLVTFKDSNWLMSIVLAHQPHFPKQPANQFSALLKAFR